MNILDYIPFGKENAIRRGELIRLTGLDDRSMRKLIEKEQLNGNLILNMQDGKGYFQPIMPDEANIVSAWAMMERSRYYTAMVKLNYAQDWLESAQ